MSGFPVISAGIGISMSVRRVGATSARIPDEMVSKVFSGVTRITGTGAVV